MTLIDHTRLSQFESRALRIMYTLLFAMCGYMVGCGLFLAVFPAPVEGHAVAEPVIAEDDPGWTCDTMGNRVCGVPDSQGTNFLICHDPAGYPIRVVLTPDACI